MTHIKFDYSKALRFFEERELDYLEPAVKAAHDSLHNGTGAGNDALGWINLPTDYDKEEFARIKKQQKNQQRLRRINRYRNRWFLPWSTCCNRNFKSFLL